MKACITCKHYQPSYVDFDGDTYGQCGLDDEIIKLLPINWYYCPRERGMPDSWEEVGCRRWEEEKGETCPVL